MSALQQENIDNVVNSQDRLNNDLLEFAEEREEFLSKFVVYFFRLNTLQFNFTPISFPI